MAKLAAPPFVSIVAPAYNEALTIVDSIRALLALEYEGREIVVVNDGSKDNTLAILTQAFELVEAPVAFEQPLKSAPPRGAYRSLVEPALVVIDKVNGGSKADALNAGINAASGQLVLVIDADTMLEPDALSRAAMPFLEHPDTVAVGGYVAIANGCGSSTAASPMSPCRAAGWRVSRSSSTCAASCSSDWRVHRVTAWP